VLGVHESADERAVAIRALGLGLQLEPAVQNCAVTTGRPPGAPTSSASGHSASSSLADTTRPKRGYAVRSIEVTAPHLPQGGEPTSAREPHCDCRFPAYLGRTPDALSVTKDAFVDIEVVVDHAVGGEPALGRLSARGAVEPYRPLHARDR
jgi:hypothetical protein